MSYAYLADRQRRERVKYVGAFLDDATMADPSKNPTMWEGPRIGSTFPPLAVREVAAMTLASLLDLPRKPEPTWTRAQWDKLLAGVKRALATSAR
jgi:hypothetical protein